MYASGLKACSRGLHPAAANPQFPTPTVCCVQTTVERWTHYSMLFLSAQQAPRLAALLTTSGRLEAMVAEVKKLDGSMRAMAGGTVRAPVCLHSAWLRVPTCR